MKLIKKITAFLLIFAMLASFMPYSILAEETPGSDGTYEWIDNGSTISITNYIGSDTNVTIPSELNGKPVTEIAGGAFSEKSVVSVIMPNSVTSVGSSAFANSTSLQSIELSYSLSIITGETFLNCSSLQSITIPNSVTAIDFTAFKNCTSLSSVTFSNALQSIGQRAFMGCTSLESITLPASVEGVQPDVFSDCTSLQSVYVYNPLLDFNTSEDDNVFDNVPLTNGIYGYDGSTADAYATSISKPFHALYTVTFNSNGGSSVSNKIAVDGSKITNPTDPTKTNYSFEGWFTDNTTFSDKWDFAADTVTADVTLFAKWHEDGTPYNNGTYEWEINEDNVSVRITKYVGSGTDVTIPSTLGGKSVTEIAGESFMGNTTIQSVVIPDSITQIAFTAFKNCSSLSSVTLPDTLEYIGQSTFEGCTSLASISFPASMIGVGNDSFKGCTSLTSVYAYSDSMQFGELGENNDIFDGSPITEGIFGFDGSTADTFAGDFSYTFNALYTVTFNTNGGSEVDKIITVEGGKISKPTSTKSGYAVAGWYTEEELFNEWNFDTDTVTSNVTLYAMWVHSDGTYGWEVNGDNISITNYFGSETNITIPSQLDGKAVTQIAGGAFRNKAIVSVIIPNSVTSIGPDAFAGCASLQSVQLPDTLTNLGGEAFLNCTSLANINIPDSITNLSYGTFKNCTSLTSITFPDTMQSIGESAFEGCASLESISLPSGMLGLVVNSFKGCTSLNTVYIYSKTMIFGGEGVERTNVFDGSPITYGIFAFADSEAQTFAEEFDYPFHALYTVTFDSNEGSSVDEIITATGTTITQPDDPNKTDYTFKGWYIDDDTFSDEWDFAHDIVTSDIILHAKWETTITYTIAAQPNNASYGSVTGSGDYTSGNDVTLTATPNNGYYFVRWLEGTAEVSTNYKYTFTSSANRTLTAVFAPIAAPVWTTVQSAGYNSISLAWSTVTGATGYDVYRSTSASGPFNDHVYGGELTSYMDTGLTTGTTYYYKVIADCKTADGDTTGSPSVIKSAKPIPTTPVITVSQTSYSSLTISWSAVDGATGYKVYRSTSASGTYTALTPTTSTSLISTGLATGTTYYYKVLAYRTEGSVTTNSAYSDVKSAKPIPATPTATAVSAGYTSVKISWPAVSGASGYTIYRSTSETTGFASYVSVSTTSYTNISLAMGTTYYYKVRAYRTVGTTKVYSNYSEVTSAVPIPSAPAPAAVSAGYTSIKVSWPAVSGATEYTIYQTDENGQVTSTLAENIKTTSYTQEGLTTNQTYYYKVIAFRTVGAVTTPSSDSVIVSAKPVPSAPTGLTAVSAGYNSVNLSWGEVTGAEGYALMRSTSINGSYEKINGGTFTSCTDNNLTTGTTYYYKVYAYINGTPDEIKGDDSAIVSVKPIPAAPNITVTATQYNSLSISWDAVDGATGYKVYRSTSASGTYAYVAPVTAGTSYTNTGLATGTTYYYKVLAYRTEGTVTTNSLYSAYKYAKVIPATPVATAASYSYNSLKISWAAISGRTAYQVYRATTESGTYSLIATTTSTSYINTSLITGNTYYYKVKAYRTVGTTKVYSSYSQVTSAKVIPSTPVVKADNASYTSNIITWPIVSGATGYLVYLTDETGTDETLLSDNNANNKNSYTHEGLTTNQTYYYKVVAYRTVSTVTTKSADSAVVSSKPIPTAPTASVLLNTYNSLNITWNTVAGADKYEIKRCDSSTGEFIKVGEAESDATNYIDTSLTTSATYYYKVVALIEPDIYGDESAVVSAKVLPAAPVVTVTPTAYNSLTLNWNSQDGVTGYRIYRSTSSSGAYTLIYTAAPTDTSYVNTPLSTGVTYYYKLIAVRTDGAVTTLSPYSVVKSAKVAPTAPTGAAAASASYSSIKVTWDKVTGASGYTVYRATSQTGTYAAIASVTSAYSSYTSTSLVTGTTYYYKVAAYRLVGTTKVYGAFSEITSAAPKPSIPVPTAISAGYTSVKISWPTALGASGYEIYKTDITGTDEIFLYDNTASNITSYTDTGLTTNQTYYYKVKSYKTTASGKVYGDFSIVVNTIPIPSTPVITVALNTYNSLNITWNTVAGADKYEISRSTSSTTGFEPIGESDNTNYIDSSLTTGTTYYYQVRAYHTEGEVKVYSSYSTIAGLKVTPTTPIVTVSALAYNSLSISWEEVSGATGYMVYRATSSSGTYTRIYTAAAGETSYINTGLATGSTYYYKVLAFVTEGTVTTNSAYSAVKSAKVAPAATTGAAAASASYTSIKITWNKVDGASGYTVYRLAPYAYSYTVAGINSTVYTNTGLITGTTYTYKVAAYRLVGTTKVYGGYSEVVSAWPKPAAPVAAAVSAGYDSVKISWPAVGGASGYEVWNTDDHIVGNDITSLSFTKDGLMAGTEYSYKVRAYKTVGTDRLYGDYSAVVSVTPIPATPSITAVTPASYNSLIISWGAIDGANKYEIWRSTSSTGEYTLLTPVADTSYEDKDLTMGATYYYKVKAYIEGTPNVYSNESAVKSATVVLPAPSSPAAATASSTSINLTWSAVGGAEGYYIYRATSATGTYSKIYTTTLTNYTDTGRATGTTYYYKLQSYNTVGSSTVTSVYSAVVSAKATLPVPLLTLELDNSDNSVYLEWSVVSGSSGYEVWRSTSLNGTYTMLPSYYIVDNACYDLDEHGENTTYYYKVRAYTTVNGSKIYSAFSEIKSVTTAYLPNFTVDCPNTYSSYVTYVSVYIVNYGEFDLTIYSDCAYFESNYAVYWDATDYDYDRDIVIVDDNLVECDSVTIPPGSEGYLTFKIVGTPTRYAPDTEILFDFYYAGYYYFADVSYEYDTAYIPY